MTESCTTQPTDPRFIGIDRLFGSDAASKLASSKVVIVGLGGVGSWTVEALARSGVGSLRLIDLDDVCTTNINRQICATTATVGRPKAEVLAERVADIHPECQTDLIPAFLTASNAERLLDCSAEIVIDATDRMSVKACIIATAKSLGAGCVTVGSAGGKRDASQIRVADLGASGRDELLRQTRRKLRNSHAWPKGEGQHFGVDAVFSPELPANASCLADDPDPDAGPKRLDCASGWGSACHITGIFGLLAAGAAIDQILKS